MEGVENVVDPWIDGLWGPLKQAVASAQGLAVDGGAGAQPVIPVEATLASSTATAIGVPGPKGVAEAVQLEAQGGPLAVGIEAKAGTGGKALDGSVVPPLPISDGAAVLAKLKGEAAGGKAEEGKGPAASAAARRKSQENGGPASARKSQENGGPASARKSTDQPAGATTTKVNNRQGSMPSAAASAAAAAAAVLAVPAAAATTPANDAASEAGSAGSGAAAMNGKGASASPQATPRGTARKSMEAGHRQSMDKPPSRLGVKPTTVHFPKREETVVAKKDEMVGRGQGLGLFPLGMPTAAQGRAEGMGGWHLCEDVVGQRLEVPSSSFVMCMRAFLTNGRPWPVVRFRRHMASTWAWPLWVRTSRAPLRPCLCASRCPLRRTVMLPPRCAGMVLRMTLWNVKHAR